VTATFDVCGPLPTGVTVLEASAGTGKTFTIAGLAARYVAGGTPLDRLLLVTFTRMATAELRDRVRERLVTAEHGLARALAGVAPDARDDVLRLLADGTRAEVEARRRRLEHALADFDAATIVTTHGFCQEVLGGLGIAGDLEPDATFVEDVRDLVDEIVDDLYLRRFLARDDVVLTRKQAAEIAHEVVRNPGAAIEPVPERGDRSPAATRARLAATVVEELAERKRQRRLMTYDDLLTRLHDVLVDEDGGPTAERLRERYDVVLIDEFQDTDPVQWGIVERAFGQGGTTLVLIGDPKQAIYAFRGAEVNAYLRAARAATTRETLGVNWRSDQGLIDAYDQLFGGAQLGDPGIVYRPVRAAGVNQTPRLSGAPVSSPLRVRVVPRDDVGVHNGHARPDPAREHIARDLAADVVALLTSDATIEVRSQDGDVVRHEHVSPGHLAVLVRRNRDAELVRDALDAAGVPAVLNGAGSVFATAAAEDWLRLLEALERPTHVARVHAAALTPFFGWSAERVACAEDDAWEDVRQRLHRWAALLRAKGVAALTETITLAEGLPARMLARVDGERALTDLRHVSQLLHRAAMEEQLGVAALTQWLRARIDESDVGDEERSRRLESDAQAVQVLTIHRSKGLEFPIVYAPFLWSPSHIPRTAVPVTFHDDEGERRVDVGLQGAAYDAHKERHRIEQRGEDLRLAYVALTRARHQAVLWWAGTYSSRDSALGRLVFCRGEDGSVPDRGSYTPPDEVAFARLQELAAAAPGCVSVEPSRLGTPASWSPPLDAPASLAARSFDRELDLRWRRTSYSDITAGAYEARVASEPEDADVVADEDAEAPALDSAPGAESLLAAMPGGVHIGTFVHRVLERTDFTAPDLAAELREHVARSLAARRLDAGDPEDVVAGLAAMLETPLGPVFDGVPLRRIAPADRLDELAFELPLAGGDEPHGRVGLAEIASVLRRHAELAAYADRLGDPGLRRDVRGYLAGAIDLVVRLPGDRFGIVDYKTNRLEGYAQPDLAREMRESHYLLQALLYVVALHRYLRWRLPAYDPASHLAGVAYLFVRGMTGPGTPPGQGVFAWQPPAALVEELSDVLDAGAAAVPDPPAPTAQPSLFAADRS